MQFTIWTVLGLLLLGVAAGSLSGLVGIGGGIVIVPALMFGLALSQHAAQAPSLPVLSLPVVGLGAL
ncbi:MAG: sulfite exporter TauE/SafE family protein, partial [Hymenobacteraceae bacterium]|nr:sulfite exporter TauE/SafE family protein [Hymenobacteraceae bacterium]